MTERSFYEYEKNAWESDLTVIPEKDMKISVDIEVLGILSHISKKINTEFSVLFKSKVSNNYIMIIPEYYIPEQEVSSASVDYIEDLSIKRKEGFNVVVHKHPNSITSFSGDDYKYINSHFPVSLLFCNGKITAATILVSFENSKIIIDVPEDRIIVSLNKEYNISTEKIKEKKYTNPTLGDYVYYHTDYPYSSYPGFREYAENKYLKYYSSNEKTASANSFDKIKTDKQQNKEQKKQQEKFIEKEVKKIKDILKAGGKNAIRDQ